MRRSRKPLSSASVAHHGEEEQGGLVLGTTVGVQRQLEQSFTQIQCLLYGQERQRAFLIYTPDTGTISSSVNKIKCQLGRAQAPREAFP